MRKEVIGNATLYLRTGRNADADALVIDFHYSARPPASVQQVVTWHEDGGLFGGDGPAVAACYFSIPPTRWSEEVFELSRLVRRPDCEKPLTGLISEACTLVKKKIDLVVSFADKTQNHHGGIYQAASWNYAGARERACDGVMIAGVFHPGRSCNSVWGTRSPEKLALILKQPVEPHYDEGKHCYWRALKPSGKMKAKRLGLAALPYPKPDIACERIENAQRQERLFA